MMYKFSEKKLKIYEKKVLKKFGDIKIVRIFVM